MCVYSYKIIDWTVFKIIPLSGALENLYCNCELWPQCGSIQLHIQASETDLYG